MYENPGAFKKGEATSLLTSMSMCLGFRFQVQSGNFLQPSSYFARDTKIPYITKIAVKARVGPYTKAQRISG